MEHHCLGEWCLDKGKSKIDLECCCSVGIFEKCDGIEDLEFGFHYISCMLLVKY
jgi:hypothetical protein